MNSNSYLILPGASPYGGTPVFGSGQGDAVVKAFNPFIVGTNMDPRTESKAPGINLFAADQATAKLAVPNPLMQTAQGTFFKDANYRNAARQIRDDLTMYTTDFRLNGYQSSKTPMALPNVLPVSFFQRE